MGVWYPNPAFFSLFFFFLDYSKKYIPQSGELAISNKDWLIFAKCIQPFFFSCIITLKEKTSANTKLSFWSIVVIFNRNTGLLTSRPYMGEQRPFAHAKYSLLLWVLNSHFQIKKKNVILFLNAPNIDFWGSWEPVMMILKSVWIINKKLRYTTVNPTFL